MASCGRPAHAPCAGLPATGVAIRQGTGEILTSSSSRRAARSEPSERLCNERASTLFFIIIELADGTRSPSHLATCTARPSHVCHPDLSHRMLFCRAQQESQCAGSERSQEHRHVGHVHSGARVAPTCITAACAHLRPQFRRSIVISRRCRQAAESAHRATAVAWSISRGQAHRRVQTLRTRRALSMHVLGSVRIPRSEV